MNKPTLIEAARAALDALGNLIDAQNGPPLIDQADEWDCAMHEAHAAIDALRAAIEAAMKEESGEQSTSSFENFMEIPYGAR